MNWHSFSQEETIKKLEANLQEGLTNKEALGRLQIYGPNKLPEEKPLSKLKIFLGQFKSPLIYILVLAGIITLFLRDFTDTIIIFAAVLLNTVVGFLQEYKASEILRELKKIVKHKARILRNNHLKIIDSSGLVPGDVLILQPGDKVPADGRIINSQNLKINEMALTGEWLAATKKEELLKEETPLADRDNMVYMGTVVEEGRGRAVIVETGLKTELGKISLMVKEAKEEETPYQKKLARFSKIIGIIIGLICLLIFIEGILKGGEFIEMFTVSVAVAVAAIPEGLPIAMTVILALGMQRILKKQGLVRKLSSAETLGSTSVIATDKTATLTEGKMKVAQIIGDKFLTLKIGVLTSEAFIENPEELKEKWIFRGRPTEKAILEAAIEIGINSKREFEKRKIKEMPFNPIDKYSAAIYGEDEGNFLYVCGAPEKVLEACSFKKEEKENLKKQLDSLAEKGLRILAAAYKIKDTEKINNLIFAGLIILKDPLRKEVKKAIEICKKAGIKPIIVTGDHRLTAKAVAQELGFKIKEENILEGTELDKLTEEELDKILKKIKIFARVEPKHKMKIIKAWQKKGEVIAMTGDGINDAPALKQADIGVALGSGTEVAKEASDLILLNDSFSIIEAAIEEGRTILDNIRKVITYLLSSSFTEIILVGFSILVGAPLPITAAQILWVNLVEDGPLAIALAFEPKERDLMEQKPGGHEIPLLTPAMKFIIFAVGIVTDLILVALFFWLLKQNYSLEYLRTMILILLAIDSVCYVFCCKSLRKNLWQINIFSNKYLIIGWLVGVSALLLAIYLPFLNYLLGTTPLRLSHWPLIISLGLVNVILIEFAKRYFIKKAKI